MLKHLKYCHSKSIVNNLITIKHQSFFFFGFCAGFYYYGPGVGAFCYYALALGPTVLLGPSFRTLAANDVPNGVECIGVLGRGAIKESPFGLVWRPTGLLAISGGRLARECICCCYSC